MSQRKPRLKASGNRYAQKVLSKTFLLCMRWNKRRAYEWPYNQHVPNPRTMLRVVCMYSVMH